MKAQTTKSGSMMSMRGASEPSPLIKLSVTLRSFLCMGNVLTEELDIFRKCV